MLIEYKRQMSRRETVTRRGEQDNETLRLKKPHDFFRTPLLRSPSPDCTGSRSSIFPVGLCRHSQGRRTVAHPHPRVANLAVLPAFITMADDEWDWPRSLAIGSPSPFKSP